jgi:peptidoglycan/LPS O-acetylase OafA/YrhL
MKDNKIPGGVYRPDIDGLRAIAVLAVLLYHAGVPYINGGFVGVDIFFVISGYLITLLLMSEYYHTNKISFSQFFIRRTQRIIPALLVILAFSTIVAVFLFTPERLVKYGGSLSSAILSISNIYFFLDSGYFDIDSSMKPLLHTWSLGVEEQFYLLWPAFIYLLIRKKLHAIYWIAGISIICVVSTQVYLNFNASAVFFLMPFRIFEFCLGALVFLLSNKNWIIKNKIINELIFTIGLVLITYSILFFSKATVFPGLNAALPCLGAALCIYSAPQARQAKLLNNRLMVKIGLISYSLYLVHWPLIVFYKYHKNIINLNTAEIILICVFTFIFSIALYFFVERPFRSHLLSTKKLAISLGLGSLLLCNVGLSMALSDGWSWRSWVSTQLSVKQVNEGKELRFKVRQQQCTTRGWEKCDDVLPNQITALVIGDSHAIDAYNAVANTFSKHDIVLSALGGCPPYVNIENLVQPGHPDLEKCKALNLQRHDIDYLKKFNYITINNLYGWYSATHLQSYLSFLNTNGIKKVIVIGGYYSLTQDMSELINKFGFDEEKIDSYKISSLIDDQIIRNITQDFGYLFISKIDAFCKRDVCKNFDENNIPFTYDKHHLSYEFANKIMSGQKNIILEYLEK